MTSNLIAETHEGREEPCEDGARGWSDMAHTRKPVIADSPQKLQESGGILR